MMCYILSRKKTGEIHIFAFDDFLLTCTNTGHGPYSFQPDAKVVREVIDSKAWLPPWEDLQGFEFDNAMILLYKISVLREKDTAKRKPTLH